MTQSGARPSLSVEHVQSLLRTQAIGRTMQAFDIVDSTNTLAAEWIERGAPHGAIIVADYQKQGRGRLGRTWSARAGLNLTFSVVLRPEMPFDRIGLLTIAACLGASKAVDRFASPLRTSVKWPNDIHINGKKMCGMLLEASWGTPDRNPAIVLGIGMNVNQEDFPAELEDRATSILLETGRITPRAELLASVLWELEAAIACASTDDEVLRREYVKRMMSFDERIRLRFADTGSEVTGIVRGLDRSGALILETDSGRRLFHAGEVTRAAQLEE